jgi:hypothetical protein
MIRVNLPSSSCVSPLADEAMHAIALEFQNKFLAYRTYSQNKVQSLTLEVATLAHETRELAMSLATCITGDTELANSVLPLMSQQDEHVREQPETQLQIAIIEGLLTCCHENKDRVQVKEIASLANSILRSRGEFMVYSPEEVSHRLDAFGFRRARNSAGCFVMLSSAVRKRVHSLATSYGSGAVHNAKRPCAQCQETPVELSNAV